MFIIELKEGGNWQIRDASDRFSDNDRRGQEASRPVREGFSPLPLQPLLSSARDLHGRERRDGTPVTRLRGIDAERLGFARTELGLQRGLPEQLRVQ